MPSSPYTTAVGEPQACSQPSRPPTNSSIPLQQEVPPNATTDPIRPPSPAPTYHTVQPDTYIPNRPSSPAPSYHTLPPNTHASAGPLNNLRDLAYNHPAAILTTLTLTNHVVSVPQGHVLVGTNGVFGRHLSARTKDGRERYRVMPNDGGIMSHVWGESPNGNRSDLSGRPGINKELIGLINGGSQGLRVVVQCNNTDPDHVHGRGDAHEESSLPLNPRERKHIQEVRNSQFSVARGRNTPAIPLVTLDYTRVQKDSHLPLPNFTVEGRDVGLRWVIYTSPPSRPNPKRSSAGAISSCRLVDSDMNVYADYTHAVGLPDLYKDGEVWGEVRLMARAVLIDAHWALGGEESLAKKMDGLYLTLVLVLDAYVRVLGGNRKAKKQGGSFMALMGV